MRPARATSLALYVLCLSARNAAARETGLTLVDARALAVEAGPDVLLARRREEIARAQIEATGALVNPTLSLSTARETARIGAGISVPVPLFGQRSTAVAAARADSDAVILETDALRVDARWNATRAWLDLWEAQQRARLLQIAATEADRLATIAQQRFAAGSTPRLDSVRTGADRARASAEARAASAGISAASARLSQWLAASGSQEPTAMPIAIRAVGTPVVGALPPQEDALARLLDRHPALAHDRALAAAAGARVRAEQRQRWPIVSAQLTVNQGDPTLPGTDVIGGVSFDAPVLSLRRGAIARARAEQTLAETTTETDARRLAALLADAFAQAQGAELKARSLENEVLPALEEASRMTEEGYGDGRLDLLRVLETRRALLDVRVAHVEAQATWQRALADLERALGVPLTQAATASAPPTTTTTTTTTPTPTPTTTNGAARAP